MNEIDYKTAYENVMIANKMLEQENKQLKDKIEKLKDYGEKVGERRNELYDIIDKAIEYIESIDKVEIRWFDYDNFHKYHLISQEELKKRVEEENLEGHFIEVNRDKLLQILGDKE